jgi:hypothetical protein
MLQLVKEIIQCMIYGFKRVDNASKLIPICLIACHEKLVQVTLCGGGGVSIPSLKLVP